MYLCDQWRDYEVLDTGDGEKLERWGKVLLRRPGKGAVTSMAWSRNGKLLAFASEAGDCGVIDLTG